MYYYYHSLDEIIYFMHTIFPCVVNEVILFGREFIMDEISSI